MRALPSSFPPGLRRLPLPALPAVLLAALSFASGGFNPSATALATLTVLALVAAGAAVAHDPLRALSAPGAVALGAFGAFAAWSLASSAWSDAPSRAVLEYDRTLLYLAVLVLFATRPRRPGDARRLAGALGCATAAVCAVGLAAHLLPEAVGLAGDSPRFRLSWPTSYWNTTGLLGAFALLAAVHGACALGARPGLRVAAAAMAPVGTAVVWFSISRGALLVVAVGLLVLLLLTRPRGLLTGGATVLAGAVVTCLVCAGAGGLAQEPITAAGLADGEQAALLMVMVVLGTAALRALGLVADRRLARIAWRGPSARVRRIWAPGLVAVAVAVALAAGGADRVASGWASFSSDAPVSGVVPPSERFRQIGGNGRFAQYRVALEHGFSAQPVHGTGAGTFALLWAQHRNRDENVLDAHSLYLEVLAELGLVGLALLVITLAVILGALVTRARSERGSWVLLAALAAGWCVGAALDWYWEMPGVTLWLFAAGGLALARPAARAPRPAPLGGRHATAVRVVLVVVTLLLALTPLAVLRSQRALEAATRAFRVADCPATVERALVSLAALDARPEPFELLSYCDVRAGRTALAERAARAAVARDPGNWEFHYVLGLTRAAGGQDPRPALRAALARNPRDGRVRRAVAAFAQAPPERWRTIALASETLVRGRP